jgi:hypothetical protein
MVQTKDDTEVAETLDILIRVVVRCAKVKQKVVVSRSI